MTAPKSAFEVLKELREEALKTGKRQRHVFDRMKFVEKFPEFRNDPRFGFTPNQFVLDVTPLEPITVGQLRKLCEDSKSPFALQKMSEVVGLAETVVVNILREDLDAIKGQIITPKASPPKPKPSTQPKNK